MNRQPTILVVDSNPDEISTSLQALRNEGYECGHRTGE